MRGRPWRAGARTAARTAGDGGAERGAFGGTVPFEFWVWLLTSTVTFGLITIYGVATLQYRLGEQALEIVALGVPFRVIRYADITAVRMGGSLWCEHWVTFRLGNRITLHLREGRRREIVITPPDADAFFRRLRSHVPSAAPPEAEASSP